MRLNEVIRPISSFKDLIISMIEDCQYKAKYDYKKLPSIKYDKTPVDFMMMLDGRTWNSSCYSNHPEFFDDIFGGLSSVALDVDIEETDGNLNLRFTYILPRWTGTKQKKQGEKAKLVVELLGYLSKKAMNDFVHWKLDENNELSIIRELFEEHVKWKPVRKL